MEKGLQPTRLGFANAIQLRFESRIVFMLTIKKRLSLQLEHTASLPFEINL